MTKTFGGLKPFQLVEYVLMLFLAISIPFHWFAAQIFEVALVACALFKVIFFQKFHFNDKQMHWKWAYIVFLLTWVAYLCGMIYTADASEGWNQVSKKLGFLLFPLIFIFSDMSYLTEERVKTIFRALVGGSVLVFLINFVWAAYDVIFNDFATTRLFDEELMKICYTHHTYLSMYAALGIAFCFVDFFKTDCKCWKTFDVVAFLILIFDTILLKSRAGLLCIVLVFIVLLVWLIFIEKKKKLGIVISAAVVVAAVAGCLVFEDSVSRITETIDNLTSENRTDRRVVQLRGYKSALKEYWMFGVGTGDRDEAMQVSYNDYRNELVDKIISIEGVENQVFEEQRDALLTKLLDVSDDGGRWYEPKDESFDFISKNAVKYCCEPESVSAILTEYLYVSNAIEKSLNAHNQYFETIISVGIIGFLLMVAGFLTPIVMMFKKKRFDVVLFIFMLIISFNALFESIFERQNGIIFYCFFNALMFTGAFVFKDEIVKEN